MRLWTWKAHHALLASRFFTSPVKRLSLLFGGRASPFCAHNGFYVNFSKPNLIFFYLTFFVQFLPRYLCPLSFLELIPLSTRFCCNQMSTSFCNSNFFCAPSATPLFLSQVSCPSCMCHLLVDLVHVDTWIHWLWIHCWPSLNKQSLCTLKWSE